MTRVLKPGDEIDYVVTYLEMQTRPSAPVPPRPANLNIALLAAEEPPLDYFLYLYGTVGSDYEWTDWFDRPRDELKGFVHNSATTLYTLMLNGWPGGFFMLDWSKMGECDLSYFGLIPESLGLGLGRWFLATAVETGWEKPGTTRMTVNTNTLDHPRALGMYQKVGFQPIRRENMRRKLTRERMVKP